MSEEIKQLVIYAWIGKDEFGSGKLGIKQARVPKGIIPIAGLDYEKITRKEIIEQLDIQGKRFNKKIRLCKFTFETILEEVGGSEE